MTARMAENGEVLKLDDKAAMSLRGRALCHVFPINEFELAQAEKDGGQNAECETLY